MSSPGAYQLKSIRYQVSSSALGLLSLASWAALSTCVRFGLQGAERKILLQNLNGPCPLIAAANALILEGQLSLPPECQRNAVASTDDVVNLLANRAITRANDNRKKEYEYHLNEVLSILPSLQHGMDVNPKFTEGVLGVEFTTNLGAFDLLGVQLVHGWLLDPQDIETWSVVNKKTYNQLTETVIAGNEAKALVESVEVQIRDKQNELDKCSEGKQQDEMHEEVINLREKMNELSSIQVQSEVANTFLSTTAHQLTYHGLEQLHKHLADGAMCVFFRNNHFATLTKHLGILYLLVTDLGYANVPEIVWEKLDEVDGNTEYLNELFQKPPPRAELKPAAGPTIAPELLLAQRSQAESDYQLALAMSKGTAPQQMDDDEGKMIDAAKALSLQSYNGDENATVQIDTQQPGRQSPTDRDHELALEYQRAQQQAQQQADHDSEQLARQLQELEYARQRAPNNNQRFPTAPASVRRSAAQKREPGCVVS